VSEQVQAALAFRPWYLLVPPYFFGWLFFRKSVCVNRLLDQARAQLPILQSCVIANGSMQSKWWRVFPTEEGWFATAEEAVEPAARWLVDNGQIGGLMGDYQTRVYTVIEMILTDSRPPNQLDLAHYKPRQGTHCFHN
jgi:hypothetical protein